jgi:hypothetical protein
VTWYLAGIDVARGTPDDDVADDRPYYELGWEITTTHLDAKHLLHSGVIDDSRDTLVTCSGREFLYTRQFRRVVDYRTFQARRQPGDRVVSLMDRYAGGRLPPDYFDRPHGANARYRHYERLRDSATTLDVRGAAVAPPRAPYCCLVIRRRAHGAYRNIGEAEVQMLLAALRRRYRHVFVVGLGVERYADPPEVTHVDLVTFTRLIQHPRCHLIVGSLTGPMHLAALVSKARVCIVMNHDHYDIERVNHPVLMGRCITYSTSRFLFVPPEALEFLLQNVSL